MPPNIPPPNFSLPPPGFQGPPGAGNQPPASDQPLEVWVETKTAEGKVSLQSYSLLRVGTQVTVHLYFSVILQVYYYSSRTRESAWSKPENVKIITQDEVERMAQEAANGSSTSQSSDGGTHEFQSTTCHAECDAHVQRRALTFQTNRLLRMRLRQQQPQLSPHQLQL